MYQGNQVSLLFKFSLRVLTGQRPYLHKMGPILRPLPQPLQRRRNHPPAVGRTARSPACAGRNLCALVSTYDP
ncbi:hypothetical protein ACN38_g3497 [Penicillium nordicum]|uniref:Uncharacterized protein n=1 Tax=Penicillium nordicum TaxID=229535 RepID=A0A0M9WHW8_9EURO|nr:hypothetical protein ACN38_g3497 [Penicillium nordicum]